MSKHKTKREMRNEMIEIKKLMIDLYKHLGEFEEPLLNRNDLLGRLAQCISNMEKK